jgi:HK97 gp10 family phage protein
MASAIVGNFAEVMGAVAATAARVEVAEEAIERAGAEMVAGLAADKAPQLTGHMAASVDDDGGVVIVDTPYAAYQEYGTRHHAAQPFLRPAAAQAEPIWSNVAEGIFVAAVL